MKLGRNLDLNDHYLSFIPDHGSNENGLGVDIVISFSITEMPIQKSPQGVFRMSTKPTFKSKTEEVGFDYWLYSGRHLAHSAAESRCPQAP